MTRVRILHPELRPTVARVNRRFPEQQRSQRNDSDTAKTGQADNRIVDDDDASATHGALARRPGSLGGPSAALKTRRSSFDSSPGHGLFLLRAKMLHGGALDYGSSKQPTPTLASLAWHPLRVYKQSGFDSRLRPHFLDREHHWPVHPALNRRGQGSSPWRSTCTGCSSVVERVPWAHEAAGAIPVIPTIRGGVPSAPPGSAPGER